MPADHAIEGKQLFRDVVEEVWHRGNLGFIRDAFTPSFLGSVPRNRHQSLDVYRRHVTGIRAAFPDVHIQVHAQVAEGDMVASHYTVRGTHLGEFMGAPPTGRPISVEAMTLHRLSGGRIAQSWTCWDVVGFLQDIGVLSEIEQFAGDPIA